MRQRATNRLLPLASLLILTACAQPASSGLPTPDMAAQETAIAAQAATAAADAAATAAANAAATALANAAATQAAMETAAPPANVTSPAVEGQPTSSSELVTVTPEVEQLPTPDTSAANEESVQDAVPKPRPTPRPAPRPAARSSGSACGRRIVHIVQPGQNLFRIALRYRTTINAIARLNGITNTRVVRAGQRLIVVTCRRGSAEPDTPVASGVIYVVRANDTLIRIALRYSTSVERLMTINQLRSPLIVAGQKLIIA